MPVSLLRLRKRITPIYCLPLSLAAVLFLAGYAQASPAGKQSVSPDAPPVDNPAIQTALIRAAERGDAAALQAALAQGASPNGMNRRISHMTALCTAAKQGNIECVKLLLEAGADLDAVDDYLQTPLYRAASAGNTSIVDLFLQRGARINTTDLYNETPLLIAAARGYDDAVRVLLHHGADTELGMWHGGDAIMWAARGGHIGCVRMLLAVGANPSFKNCALYWAYVMGQPPAVLRVLKKAGAVPQSPFTGQEQQ